MRLTLLAAALLVSVTAAHADTFQITFTPANVPYDPNQSASLQLTLPATPTRSNSESFTFQAVPVVLGGTPIYTDVVFASYIVQGSSTLSYAFGIGDGIGLGSSGDGVVTYPPPVGDTPGYSALYVFLFTNQQLFTGPLNDPTLIPGTYGDGPNFNPPDVLTITDLSTGPAAVTPEPASFALLGTGLLGLAGLLRRRFN